MLDRVLTSSLIFTSLQVPMLIGWGVVCKSIEFAIACAQSSTYKNSRLAFPVPQISTLDAPSSIAFPIN